MPDRADFVTAAGMTPPRRAPYTFARLNEVVLPSLVGSAPSHARPLPDGVCGELSVTWTVETPLLIGGSGNGEPVTLGEGGRPILPGASLRGLIRAVAEIAAYGRLNFVDDARFGLRDYDHWTWREKTKDFPIRAGWLKAVGVDRYQLEPVRGELVPISGILKALGWNPDDPDPWHRLSLADRMDALARAGLAGEIDLGRVDPRLAGRHGTLVVAGAALRDPGQTTNKAWEAAFTDEADGKALPLSGREFEIFDRLAPKDAATHAGPPETNWSYWRPRLEAGDRVPVFFRGRPGGRPFFMWLTRLMRAPFDHTVRDVARRSQPDLDANEFDLVEALFGWVPEDEPETPPRQRRGREQARQGRVFFHHASLIGDPPVAYEERSGVTMQPRASFYPFYLRARPSSGATHPVDYDNEHARLAGRKRYPARNRCADALPKPPDASKEKQTVRLRFLPATPKQPLAFTSRVRVHNVSEVELGALVWAVTFGRHGRGDGGSRHMLGRAKAFGFGQVGAEITGQELARNLDGDPPDLGGAMAAFQTWALAALATRGVTAPSFAELPEIGDLLAAAHAATGRALAAHLCFTRGVGNNEAEQTLKGYQTLRNLSGHGPGGAAPGHAGEPAPESPTGTTYVALPAYPRPETPIHPVEAPQKVVVDGSSWHRKKRRGGR